MVVLDDQSFDADVLILSPDQECITSGQLRYGGRE